jgi:hypothetical protein
MIFTIKFIFRSLIYSNLFVRPAITPAGHNMKEAVKLYHTIAPFHQEISK